MHINSPSIYNIKFFTAIKTELVADPLTQFHKLEIYCFILVFIITRQLMRCIRKCFLEIL